MKYTHRRRLAPLLASAALALAACASPTRSARRAEPGERTLRVVTYNVNFGLAGDAATRDAIFARDADVICLQETTPAWEAVVREAAAADRYPYVRFTHSRGAGGLAIISRLPITALERNEAPAPGWFPAWRAVVDFDGTPVQLLSLHLRPPVSDTGSFISGYWQADAVHTAEIGGHHATLDPGLPTIVLGDLNESADGAAIEWLEARGFTNALPQFHPSAHTWRWDTSVGQITSDLDHVLYNAHLEPLAARVEQRGRSDHLPVVVDFVLATPR